MYEAIKRTDSFCGTALISGTGAFIGGAAGFVAGVRCFPRDGEPCLSVGHGVLALIPAAATIIGIACTFFPCSKVKRRT